MYDEGPDSNGFQVAGHNMVIGEAAMQAPNYMTYVRAIGN